MIRNSLFFLKSNHVEDFCSACIKSRMFVPVLLFVMVYVAAVVITVITFSVLL
jgi:hypothetical protein